MPNPTFPLNLLAWCDQMEAYCAWPRTVEFEVRARTDLPRAVRVIRGLMERTDSRPEIVCLCGSTRFMETFFDEGWRLTLEGKIVLSVGVWRQGPEHHAGEWIGEEVKQRLDELHKRKIDLADRVLVLNVGGYIGESTRSEIEYAETLGKPIDYLEAALQEARDERGL